MTNEPSSEAHPDKVWIIYAVCINCNKRLTSMRAISMHLKMTATRHVVNFINYGDYDKKTELREMNRSEFLTRYVKSRSWSCRGLLSLKSTSHNSNGS